MTFFKHPKISCSFCGKPVKPNSGRMRMHQSESTRFSGNVLATFHLECGDALLSLCEANLSVAQALAHDLQPAEGM